MTNFNKPTLKQLRNRAITEINTNVKGGDANLRRNYLNVIATALAGIGDEILRRVEYVLKQTFVQEADEESLIKHGQERKFPRKAATKANGPIDVTGTSGSTIASGVELQRSDNVKYITTEEVSVGNDGTASVPVEAINAGLNGNAGSGTIVSFVSPVAGVNIQATVASAEITGGTDIEDIEEYRARLLEYEQNPPMGGNKKDYEVWAKEVSGVTRAWCYPIENGAGTVTVRFMMDNSYANGIPHQADITRVQNYIDSERPATAVVTVAAPTTDTVNITFSALSPNTTAIKAAITENLQKLFKSSLIEPGVKLYLSKINEAISTTAGVTDHKLSAPSADINPSTGHIPVLGTITFPSE